VKAIARALADAARQLDKTSDTARLDSELLMAEALHIDRDKLILSPPDRKVPDRFWDMVERPQGGRAGRLYHRPPRLLEHRAPRRPGSASSRARFGGADRRRDRAFRRHGTDRSGSSTSATGPGTLVLAALDVWPEANGLGTDVSRQALAYAAANARRLGFENRVKLAQGNWAEGLLETFDLILCNPAIYCRRFRARPGVREYEPDEALFAGREGLDAYQALAPQLPHLLNRGGSPQSKSVMDQAKAVTRLLARGGLRPRWSRDLAGRDRAVLLTWR
jgi:release factor glutamine methyltransferase